MIAIERVSHVEKIERDDVRGMLLREQVRPGKVKNGVTGGRRLGRENTVLVVGHD